MPWRDVRPMDEKVLFIADYLRGVDSFGVLCERYGISRKTGYKWVNRYRECGSEGLHESSRRPHLCPIQTPYHLRKAIIELRRKSRIKLSSKKIQILLQQQFPNEDIPSKTTIYNILRQEDLIGSRGRRARISPYAEPFSPVREANDLWTADFKGQFKIGNGKWCYPLTVMDHHSRYLMGCEGLPGPRYADTQRRFIRLFKEYGLPRRIRTDNGIPFATLAAGGLSCLAVWWIRLGILPERIEPGKPQQNGRHERMHRTLKQAVAKPPAYSFAAQQKRHRAFQQEYNYQRPHEALNQQTPASQYSPSSRTFPDKLPELVYPDYYDVKKVSSNGVIFWRGGHVYVSHLLPDEWVGMNEINEGVWEIYYGPVRLGRFDERNEKGHSVSYWSIKV